MFYILLALISQFSNRDARVRQPGERSPLVILLLFLLVPYLYLGLVVWSYILTFLRII